MSCTPRWITRRLFCLLLRPLRRWLSVSSGAIEGGPVRLRTGMASFISSASFGLFFRFFPAASKGSMIVRFRVAHFRVSSTLLFLLHTHHTVCGRAVRRSLSPGCAVYPAASARDVPARVHGFPGVVHRRPAWYYKWEGMSISRAAEWIIEEKRRHTVAADVGAPCSSTSVLPATRGRQLGRGAR